MPDMINVHAICQKTRIRYYSFFFMFFIFYFCCIIVLYIDIHTALLTVKAKQKRFQYVLVPEQEKPIKTVFIINPLFAKSIWVNVKFRVKIKLLVKVKLWVKVKF